MAILGLDIGGANIKAADEAGLALSRSFEIWRYPERLAEEIAIVLGHFPETTRVAVTMTAELADCFSTKSEGVRSILDAVEGGIAVGLPGLDLSEHTVAVWTTRGQFLTTDEARNRVREVAAANWHALATLCGRLVPVGSSLLIDIGSTTTDIIPILNGKPMPVGLTDTSRLQSGELSYSGVRRTPLCALAQSVPFRVGYCSLAAELFSTTLDIHLLLGQIKEEEEKLDTADGRPATKSAAHDRIARMICGDRDEVAFDEAVQISRFLADVQRQRLAGMLDRVARRFSEPCRTVIVSGSGAFLAQQLITESRYTANTRVISLAKQLSPEIAESACAYAVAQLLGAPSPFLSRVPSCADGEN